MLHIICHAEAQDVYSDGSSPHKSIVSDDADEVFGESIDEDSQSVKQPSDTAPPPSTSGAWAPSLCLKISAPHYDSPSPFVGLSSVCVGTGPIHMPSSTFSWGCFWGVHLWAWHAVNHDLLLLHAAY